MSNFRLGDIIDDHCIKCRRVTNHAIVSLVNSEPAKVRCRTCYHDHDFRHEQAPPSKKDLKKAELFKEVLASAVPAGMVEEEVPHVDSDQAVDSDPAVDSDDAVDPDDAVDSVPPVKAVKKVATRGKKA